MKLSRNGRILATLLIVLIVGGILLTPLGFETRASAFLASPSSRLWLVLAFVGLILTPASLLILFFRPRIASILATIGSIALVVLSLADQAGLAVSIPPPLPITVLEVVTTAIIAVILFFSSRVYKETSLAKV